MIQAEASLEQFALDRRGVKVVPVAVVRRRLVDAVSGVHGSVTAVLVVRKLLSELFVSQCCYQFDGASALVRKMVDRCHGYHSTAKDSVSYA